MAAPTLTHTGQRLYDALAPFAADDPDNDYAVAVICATLAASKDQTAELTRDQDDGTPGFAILFDPARCPAWLLEWAAQFVGVRMLPNLTEAQQRLRYAQTDGWQRGTPDAMIGAARQFLVGPDGTGASATVYVIERVGGNAYQYAIATLASETPDEDAVLRALLEQKPAGLVLDYGTIVGGDWETLRSTHTDWDDVKAQFTSWDELRANPAIT